MEPSYEIKFRVGKLILCKYIPEIVRRKGWFIAIEYPKYIHPIFVRSKEI